MTFDQAVTAVMERIGCERSRAETVVRANPHLTVGSSMAFPNAERTLIVADDAAYRAARGVSESRMNSLETRRASELEALKRAGEIRSYQFEAVKLILADRTTYTPDFLVELNDRALVLEETKGHWRDDARVKIKVAARLFPMFQFVALTPRKRRDGGGWKREEFHP